MEFPEFLTGNPFSTPVGQRIEQATSSSLPSEDWALNMEICDVVNTTDEGCVCVLQLSSILCIVHLYLVVLKRH
uniref:Target of myb1 membrane trafficking protein n=1 Tax=Myripristis murdjan TaxID=586833 RepID=A0A667X281_9TELE